MASERIACVHIPDFPLEVCLKHHPEPGNLPVAIAERPGDSSPIASLNRPALEFGLSRAMTIAQAHSRCPDLRVHIRNHQHEDEQSGILIKLLQSVGPFVEEHTPGVYYLEASGLMRLYKTEPGLADTILTALGPAGYPVQIGLAANKPVARIAANLAATNHHRIVESNTEREFLAPLAIEQLFLPEDTRATLHALGIKTIGQLAAFPPHEITRRFGSDTTNALGREVAFILAECLQEKKQERLILDYPVYANARLIAHLEPLLDKLLTPMERAGQGCHTMLLTFVCDNHTTDSLHVTLDQSTASAKLFIRQLGKLLETHRLHAGITDITVTIPETTALSAEQLTLQREPNTGAKTVALPDDLKGRHLYGIEQQPRTLPEQGYVLISLPQPKRKPAPRPASVTSSFPPYAMRPVYGLRLFTPARQAQIESDSGRLLRMSMHNRMVAIINQRGPWRLSGGWWQRRTEAERDNIDSGFYRMYYEIDTAENKAWLLFYDRLATTWFLQGVFD